jgi:hypothetical protein
VSEYALRNPRKLDLLEFQELPDNDNSRSGIGLLPMWYKMDHAECADDVIYRHLTAKRAWRIDNPETETTICSPPVTAEEEDGRFWMWSGPDCLAVAGMISLLLGFVFALFPAYRAGGVLFPIGAALLAVTGYWARYRDSHLT